MNLSDFPIQHLEILADLEARQFPIISAIGVQQFRAANRNTMLALIQDVYGFESNHKPNSITH